MNLRLMKEIDDEVFARNNTELRDRIATLKEKLDGCDVSRGEQAEQTIKVLNFTKPY